LAGNCFHTPYSTRQKLRYKNLSLNAPHGDTLTPHKQKSHTRIHFQNPNGFQLIDQHGGTFRTAASHIQTLNIDAGGFSEHNLDTQNAKVQKKMSRALRETSKHFRLQTASSSINANYEYKPGGTVTYIRDHLCSRFHSKGRDPMGRWSFIKLHKRGGTKVVLLTLYQP